MTHPPDNSPVLSVEGVRKQFPGVLALDEVRLEIQPGEVHALLGENGAGKSTLIKVLAGAHQPDAGVVRMHGREQRFLTPRDAEGAGIGVIFQEFNLVPHLTVRDNLFLGRERSRAGFVRRGEEIQEARRLLGLLGAEIDTESRCSELSVAHQQLVEIAKALALDAKVLIMDEPTAALTDQEVEALFRVIQDLQTRGVAVVYVSHRLDEIFAICDRVTVLRDGRYVDSRPVPEMTRQGLIELMVGRSLENEFPDRPPNPGDVVVRAERLERPGVGPVSFEIRRGEVLAFTGLVGSGRTEVMRMLFGADPVTGGRLTIDGATRELRTPRDAIRAGLCLLTEDRKHQGLILGHTVKHNFGLPNAGAFARGSFLTERAEARAFSGHVEALKIKISSHEQAAGNLSGGNQQKVVLAKWLERDSKVLLFDEPTRGIDVGAKYEIYELMHKLVDQGKAIVMVSSELPEVLGMADRVLVMREGRIAGEITDVKRATQQDIMQLAVGGDHSIETAEAMTA